MTDGQENAKSPFAVALRETATFIKKLVSDLKKLAGSNIWDFAKWLGICGSIVWGIRLFVPELIDIGIRAPKFLDWASIYLKSVLIGTSVTLVADLYSQKIKPHAFSRKLARSATMAVLVGSIASGIGTQTAIEFAKHISQGWNVFLQALTCASVVSAYLYPYNRYFYKISDSLNRALFGIGKELGREASLYRRKVASLTAFMLNSMLIFPSLLASPLFSAEANYAIAVTAAFVNYLIRQKASDSKKNE